MSRPTITLPRNGVYPAQFFQRRIDEELSRARRSQGIVALLLFSDHRPEFIRAIRENARQMDVVGLSNRRPAVLLSEVVYVNGERGWSDRLMQMARAILRLAAVTINSPPLYPGACLLPEKKNGKIVRQTLFSGAEMAVKIAAEENQAVIYTGLQRFAEAPKPPDSPEIIRIGDLHIDREHTKIAIGAEILSLRRKEFDLFSYLLKNAGKTVTREGIFRSVWDSEYFNSTRTIDLHIAQVRKALQTSRCLQIQTVKGLGYRLERLD